MFNSTKRFQSAVSLMNEVDESRFPRLVQRITERIGQKQQESFFTTEEETALQEMLSLSESNLSLLIDAVSYVLEQAAYNGISVDNLSSQLAAAGLNEAKTQQIGSIYGEQGRALVSRLREQTLGGPLILDTVKWQMGLQIAHDGLSRLKEPTALFEFGLQPEDPADAGKAEKLMVEFTHQELFKFFQDLETIQEQVDRLA